MNTVIRRSSMAAALVVALSATSFATAASFNYHGNLSTSGQAANGQYDLQISVYPSATASVPKGPAHTVYGVQVHEGAFNTEIDLDADAQGGGFIGVAVRKTGETEFESLGGRTTLAPDGTCPDAWLIDGNAGTTGSSYVGTSDAKDFHVAVNGVSGATFYAATNGVSLAPFALEAVPGAYAVSLALSNGAAGDYSIAGGYNASTVNEGSIVFADRNSGPVSDTGPDQFIVQATGGAIVNGNALLFSTDDTVLYPRSGGGDDDSDLTLVSRGGNFGRLFIEDAAPGDLYIQATNGVYISNPVEIDGDLASKNIRVTGSASKSTAGAWKANSDGRIKQNIEPVAGALQTLQQIRPVTFEYTDAYRSEHPEVAPQRYYNVIAQQFAQVFPDAVTPSGEYLPGAAKTSENEVLQVDTYPAQIVTIAAVQELAQKNASLQRTVDRLMARIEKLEAAQGR